MKIQTPSAAAPTRTTETKQTTSIAQTREKERQSKAAKDVTKEIEEKNKSKTIAIDNNNGF